MGLIMTQDFFFAVAALAFTTGGAAWAGVKLSLNGMRRTNDRIEKKLDAVAEDVQGNRNRITAVETRCTAYHGTHPLQD